MDAAGRSQIIFVLLIVRGAEACPGIRTKAPGSSTRYPALHTPRRICVEHIIVGRGEGIFFNLLPHKLIPTCVM